MLHLRNGTFSWKKLKVPGPYEIVPNVLKHKIKNYLLNLQNSGEPDQWIPSNMELSWFVYAWTYFHHQTQSRHIQWKSIINNWTILLISPYNMYGPVMRSTPNQVKVGKGSGRIYRDKVLYIVYRYNVMYICIYSIVYLFYFTLFQFFPDQVAFCKKAVVGLAARRIFWIVQWSGVEWKN